MTDTIPATREGDWRPGITINIKMLFLTSYYYLLLPSLGLVSSKGGVGG